MVQLADGDIKTREVLGWKGVHVLHFMGSSCSQKLRIFLNLKGIPWQSHPIDLPAYENMQPWFLGINPRGLVPVLVHDGAVHIESNDIIQYLERKFPTPRLIPAGHENEVAALLKHEDDLHLDLRTLSFRFVFAPPGPPIVFTASAVIVSPQAEQVTCGSKRAPHVVCTNSIGLPSLGRAQRSPQAVSAKIAGTRSRPASVRRYS